MTELNELIYAGAKLVWEKIGVPIKSTNRKSKPGWEIQLEKQIKNTKTDRNEQAKENRWNVEQKSNTRKNNNTSWANKPESNGKRRKI